MLETEFIGLGEGCRARDLGVSENEGYYFGVYYLGYSIRVPYFRKPPFEGFR